MDEIYVNEGMMDVLQMVANAAKLKRDNPEHYDEMWKIAEHEIMNSVMEDVNAETNPVVAMIKESITRTIIESIKKDPTVMLELERLTQEIEES